MRVRSSLFFRPSSMAMWGAIASAAVWSIPIAAGELRTGYDVPSPLTLANLLVIFDWYALIFVCLRLGEMLGFQTRIFDLPRAGRVALESKLLLTAYTGLSAIGLAITYSKILGAISFEEMFFFLTTGVGNELKENLYESYSAGLVSLRYLVMCALALSATRLARTRRPDLFFVANVVLLLMSAIISSRLIFVSGVLVSVFLINHRKKYLKLNLGAIAVFVGIVFTILATLNYSRNSNYYAADGFEFWGAGLSSIVTYVGSPFQVVLSVANFPEGVVGQPVETYRSFTDISETLNSNSAFVALHETIGYWAWLYVATLTFLAGFVFSKCLKQGRTAFLLPCGAILYASAELWRLDLFTQGIFLVWMAVGLTLPYAIAAVGGLLRRRHVARRRARVVRSSFQHDPV